MPVPHCRLQFSCRGAWDLRDEVAGLLVVVCIRDKPGRLLSLHLNDYAVSAREVYFRISHGFNAENLGNVSASRRALTRGLF